MERGHIPTVEKDTTHTHKAQDFNNRRKLSQENLLKKFGLKGGTTTVAAGDSVALVGSSSSTESRNNNPNLQVLRSDQIQIHRSSTDEASHPDVSTTTSKVKPTSQTTRVLHATERVLCDDDAIIDIASYPPSQFNSSSYSMMSNSYHQDSSSTTGTSRDAKFTPHFNKNKEEHFNTDNLTTTTAANHDHILLKKYTNNESKGLSKQSSVPESSSSSNRISASRDDEAKDLSCRLQKQCTTDSGYSNQHYSRPPACHISSNKDSTLNNSNNKSRLSSSKVNNRSLTSTTSDNSSASNSRQKESESGVVSQTTPPPTNTLSSSLIYTSQMSQHYNTIANNLPNNPSSAKYNQYNVPSSKQTNSRNFSKRDSRDSQDLRASSSALLDDEEGDITSASTNNNSDRIQQKRRINSNHESFDVGGCSIPPGDKSCQSESERGVGVVKDSCRSVGSNSTNNIISRTNKNNNHDKHHHSAASQQSSQHQIVKSISGAYICQSSPLSMCSSHNTAGGGHAMASSSSQNNVMSMVVGQNAWTQHKIHLRPQRRGVHLVTDEVLKQIPEVTLYQVGILHLQILHTSASLTVNENWDPDVREDMEMMLNHIVPQDGPKYTHSCEGPDDMPAHVKACFIGPSITIPITQGSLNLGTWQGVWLCEHREKAGSRKLMATINGIVKDNGSNTPAFTSSTNNAACVVGNTSSSHISSITEGT